MPEYTGIGSTPLGFSRVGEPQTPSQGIPTEDTPKLSACHKSPVVICEGTLWDVPPESIRAGSTYGYGCTECHEWCDLYSKLDTSNPPAQKLDKSQQDDKQLREKYADFNHIGDGRVLATPQELEAYFTERQLQLVSELEGELPEKEPVVAPIGLHELEAELNDEYRGHNKAIDKVTALLEHKKQELEGKI